MTDFNAVTREAARKLIEKYGKTVAYTSVTFASATSSAADGRSKSVYPNIKIVIDEFNDRDRDITGLAADGILAGDRKILMHCFNPFTPKSGDQIKIDTEGFSVFRLKTTFGGELPSVYTLQIRRA